MQECLSCLCVFMYCTIVEIEFRNVHFNYPSRPDESVLKVCRVVDMLISKYIYTQKKTVGYILITSDLHHLIHDTNFSVVLSMYMT